MAATFTFLLVERLYPSGVAAFLATVLGSWYVWQYDDLATGSPRAFLLPLTVVLLYGLAAGWRWWLVVGVVAIEALVYPSAAALGVVLVGARLVRLERWPPRLSTDWSGVADGAVRVRGVCVVLLAPTVLRKLAVRADGGRQNRPRDAGVRSERSQRVLLAEPVRVLDRQLPQRVRSAGDRRAGARPADPLRAAGPGVPAAAGGRGSAVATGRASAGASR